MNAALDMRLMLEEGNTLDNHIQKELELRKDLGLVAALSLVVGMVLGAGAFMKPPAVLAAAGDSSTALIAWAIGGALSMAGGLTMCELGVLFPRTGGVYVYLEELYGEKIAFLYGWVIMTVFGPATVGALCGYFSSVFCLLFDLPARFSPVVAAGVLAFVLMVNSINVRAAGKLQTVATFCKLIPIVLLSGFGLWQGNGQVMGVTAGVKTAAPFSVAVLATLFAYDGWAQVASVAGEMKNPGKILPRAIIGGVSFLCLVYAMINVAFLKVLPADQITALGHDASAIIAQQLFGLSGGNLIAVGIMISILGGLNGYIMTLSRTIFVLAERKQIPGFSLWRTIDPDSQSPLNAMFLLAGLSYFYYRLLDADRLTDVAMFSIWLFYLAAFIGVFVARRTHAELPRSYRVPLYPLIPGIAVVGAIYVLIGMITNDFANGMASIGLMVLGLPVYFFMRSRHSDRIVLPSLKKRYQVALVLVCLVALVGASTHWLDSRPEIRVGIEATSPPFAFEENGKLTGYDVELIEAVAARAGYRVKYRTLLLQNLFEAFDKDYIDAAISSLSVTPARQQRVGFTVPYIDDGGLALLAKVGISFASVNDLSGRRVGVHEGSTGQALAQGIPGAKIQAFRSNFDLNQSLVAGGIDAILHDRLMLEYAISQGQLPTDAQVVSLQAETYAIAMSKTNKELAEKLNKALLDLKKEGALTQLRQKWLSQTK